MRKIMKGYAQDEATYFLLVKRGKKADSANDTQRKKGRIDVNAAVKKEGGECRLYATSGSSFDFVSVITGISVAGAVRIAAEIGKSGVVTATLIPGIELFG